MLKTLDQQIDLKGTFFDPNAVLCIDLLLLTDVLGVLVFVGVGATMIVVSLIS